MKKLLIISLLILSLIINQGSAQAKTTPSKTSTKSTTKAKSVPKVSAKAKPKAKATTKKGSGYGTTMPWDKDALKMISNLNGFDGSTYIRSVYIKKVEAYAKRNNLKIVTGKVFDDMRE